MNLGPLIVDISGIELSEEDTNILIHPLVGGVILFSRNYISKKQLKKLTSQIKSLPRKTSLLVCVDQEGGRVQRFKKDFTHLPSLRNIGENWKSNNAKTISFSLQKAYNCSKILACELKEVGVDFSFTPVLDLDWGRSTVIGDRSISRDPYIVYSIASSIMSGLMSEGMKNCGKHFPGHGWAQADSHHEKAMDNRNVTQLEKTDLIPYQLLCETKLLSSVMPAHVVYSNVDAKPAGFSKIWLQEILRKKLKFDGVIISDDLSMKAATLSGNILDRMQLAFEAGCDSALICNDRKSVIEALDNFSNSFDELEAKFTFKNLKMLKPFF